MKPILRGLTLALLATALTGCGFIGGIFGGDDEGPQPAELVDFDAELRFKTQWSANIGRGLDEKYLKLVPVLDADRIYVTDSRGLLMALNANTGKRIWRTRLKLPLSGGVGVGFGQLFVGTSSGVVVALNADDGSELWRANLSSEILSVPQTNGSVVIVQTLDEKVYALDHDTGEQSWFYESIIPALTLRGSSTPVVTSTIVFVGLANGKIVALSAQQGQPLWEKRVSVPGGSSELERMTDVDGDPLLIGETLYVSGFQGNTVAIDVTTARIRWLKDVSSHVGPDEGFGNIYVTDSNGHISAFDQGDGQSVWKQAALDYRKVTAPKAFANYLAVGDFEGYLHLLSQIDGRFLARKKIDGDGIQSAMVAQGDKLYVYGNSGKLVALTVQPLR